MGLFDEITAPELPCPKCGKPISGWQSKSGPCSLDILPFSEVDEFYSSCRQCNVFVTFKYKTKKPPDRTMDDYEMIVE